MLLQWFIRHTLDFLFFFQRCLFFRSQVAILLNQFHDAFGHIRPAKLKRFAFVFFQPDSLAVMPLVTMPLARNSRGMAADPIPILQERDFLLRRMRLQKELLSFFFPATVLIASDKNLVDLIFSDEAVQLCNFLQRRNVIPALGEHFF